MASAPPFSALLVENIHPDADRALAAYGPVEVSRLAASPDPGAFKTALAAADVLGIRSRTQVTEAMLETAPRLLAIGCFCIGVNQVDLTAAARRGAPVFNAPFANTRSVAELTIASVIMLMRRIPEKASAARAGRWLKSAEGAREVRKKKLGIVGYGNIGAQLSVIASALGMHVYYYDIEPKLAHGNATPVESLSALLELCDIITLHTPSTPQTRGLIGRAELSKMKPGAILINQARGDLVDIEALAEALEAGRIAGAAIDVFPEEPKSKDEPFASPLQKFENVLLTPHIGGSTLEAQAAIGLDAATKLARYVHEGSTSHAVNFPQVEPGPLREGRVRVTAAHANAPGYLSRLNETATAAGANIAMQLLQTEGELGYAVTDLEGALPEDFLAKIEALSGTIRARLLYPASASTISAASVSGSAA